MITGWAAPDTPGSRGAVGSRSVRQRLRRIGRSLALQIPPIKRAVEELDSYRQTFNFVPPGHFYSPLPSLDEVTRDAGRLFGPPPTTLPGIELNEATQLALLEEIKGYYSALPFSPDRSAEHRYFYENPAYSYADAIFLYGMIRHAAPKRIVEVGSGHSSCAMLDTAELFLEGDVDFTFIEPYPGHLLSLLRPDDLGRVTILAQRVQDIALEPFLALQRNDILFVDSSHVMKVGSDVHYLLTEILPRLRPGVYVHIHDVMYPFEYPEGWIRDGRAWNESYALRAFLTFNDAFEIVLFNTYLAHFHRDIFERDMPLCLKNVGGSIWLRRVR
jgi:predicted O-methyltransferase YrrM